MESKSSSSTSTSQSPSNISSRQDESPIRITQHPLVSALLWFCGSKVGTKDGLIKSDSGRILWNNKSNNIILSDKAEQPDGENKSAENSDFEITQSPQWGFYVAITPPVDDCFVRSVKIPKGTPS